MICEVETPKQCNEKCKICAEIITETDNNGNENFNKSLKIANLLQDHEHTFKTKETHYS